MYARLKSKRYIPEKDEEDRKFFVSFCCLIFLLERPKTTLFLEGIHMEEELSN